VHQSISQSLSQSAHNNNNNNNNNNKVLNVDLNDDQWLQASLPVGEGGLGIRSAQMLAPSAFLASAASTSALQQSILPDSVSLLEDQSVTSTETRWSSLSGSTRCQRRTAYPEGMG